MQTRLFQRRTMPAAWLVCVAIGASSPANGPAVHSEAYAPLLNAPSNTPEIRVAVQVVPPVQNPPRSEVVVPAPIPAPPVAAPSAAEVPAPVVPPAQIVPQPPILPPAQALPPPGPLSPLLQETEPIEELLPGFEQEPVYEQRGVRPYGGGHPDDWSWGCNGSPYRTNGMCDDWKVGCAWHVTVDGIVMSREGANLDALAEEMEDNHQGEEDLENPVFEDFGHGPGGRITFTSQVPHYVGYQIQFVYEGIEAWNSWIVFEKEDFEPEFFTAVITTETETDTDITTNGNVVTTTVTTTTNPTTGTTTTVTVTSNGTTTETETETTTTHSYDEGPIPLQPDDFPNGFEQRSLHYRSNYHSGEFNFLQGHNPMWRPYCGFRYIKFDDEINDFTNQEVQPPLPFEGPDNVPPGEFLAVAETDRLNLFDIENNLMGFQIGLIHDSWKVNGRLAIEGFVNSGLYYNKIKYTNMMGVFTTQQIADDTSTVTVDESRIDFSDAVNNDVRELSEISYHAEASLSAVCRLNKCWALRSGYQALWIANVHLAEDAFLDGETEARDLFFHGWHAGIECRR